MATCDLCGKDTDSRSEQVSLYAAKLKKRTVSKPQLAGAKTTSTFEDVKPVTLTICNRHKRDLYIQRLVAGLIAFIFLYFPILWLVSLFLSEGSREALIIQAVAAFVLALIVSILLSRLVRYDGLIASMMTIEGKKKGSSTEYFTEKKYRRYAASQEKSA